MAGSLYDAAICCDVDAVQRMIADGADVEKSPVSRELEELGARGGVWRAKWAKEGMRDSVTVPSLALCAGISRRRKRFGVSFGGNVAFVIVMSTS